MTPFKKEEKSVPFVAVKLQWLSYIIGTFSIHHVVFSQLIIIFHPCELFISVVGVRK